LRANWCPIRAAGRAQEILRPDMACPSDDDAALATTRDDFLGGALSLLQPKSGYRAGLDAVLLAAACQAVPGQRVLDCGAGVGTVGLALARRVPGVQVTLVERDETLAGLAVRNGDANGLAARVTVVCADLTAPLARAAALAPLASTFDHVLANPPYYAQGAGTRAADPLKDGSHAMPEGRLEDWVRFAAAMAREGGTLTIVHRPDALPEVLAALERRFGDAHILPLHPRAGAPATRVLIQVRKGSRAGMTLCAGRVLHAEGGHGFTPEFDAVLRGGAGLWL
jgi:tRNA1(Val) A37 N6-methylase TrmN6